MSLGNATIQSAMCSLSLSSNCVPSGWCDVQLRTVIGAVIDQNLQNISQDLVDEETPMKEQLPRQKVSW